IVGAYERLLVREQRGHDRDTGQINRSERRHEREPDEAGDGNRVHDARDRQRRGDAESDRDRAQAVRAIELEVLTGVHHVEAADAIVTNAIASPIVIAPRGSSRAAVRGLSASIRASTSRLNPIAALRAPTIATTIHKTMRQVIGVCCAARSAPASANGSANTEWLTRTNEAYVRSFGTSTGVTLRSTATDRAECRSPDILPHRR